MSEHLNVIRALIPDPDTDVAGLVRDLQGPDAEAEPVDERIKQIEAKAETHPARRATNGARLEPRPWPEAMEPPC